MVEELCKRRYFREIKNLHETKEFIVDSDASNFRKIRALIKGPPNTPYENVKYIINIRLSDNYPLRPPTVQFRTKVFHPNISAKTG